MSERCRIWTLKTLEFSFEPEMLKLSDEAGVGTVLDRACASSKLINLSALTIINDRGLSGLWSAQKFKGRRQGMGKSFFAKAEICAGFCLNLR